MWRNLNILLTITIFLSYYVTFTNQVFFILDPLETRCISKEMVEKTSFGGVYFISGENEEGNRAFIKNNENQNIWENIGQKNGSFNLIVERAGNISIIY
jgi:hypothetical protein